MRAPESALSCSVKSVMASPEEPARPVLKRAPGKSEQYIYICNFGVKNGVRG